MPDYLTTPSKSTYLELGSDRFDSSISSMGGVGTSTLATPLAAPGQILYSSATKQLVVNVGSWATPVIKRITTI